MQITVVKWLVITFVCRCQFAIKLRFTERLQSPRVEHGKSLKVEITALARRVVSLLFLRIVISGMLATLLLLFRLNSILGRLAKAMHTQSWQNQ